MVILTVRCLNCSTGGVSSSELTPSFLLAIFVLVISEVANSLSLYYSVACPFFFN